MKATFVFDMNDPDDIMDHKRMSNALGMALVLWEIKVNVKKKMEYTLDTDNLSGQETLDRVFEMIGELMEDQGLNMENLIQ
jgi:xylose isomerase